MLTPLKKNKKGLIHPSRNQISLIIEDIKKTMQKILHFKMNATFSRQKELLYNPYINALKVCYYETISIHLQHILSDKEHFHLLNALKEYGRVNFRYQTFGIRFSLSICLPQTFDLFLHQLNERKKFMKTKSGVMDYFYQSKIDLCLLEKFKYSIKYEFLEKKNELDQESTQESTTQEPEQEQEEEIEQILELF